MSTHSPKDPALADHLAWLGYVQPEGLVVSAPALVERQANIEPAQPFELQRCVADCFQTEFFRHEPVGLALLWPVSS